MPHALLVLGIQRWKQLFPYLLMFFVGLCLMVVEVVSSRIVAPYIGVSIFTWTSLIGVVLIGISMGVYVGGVWADQQRSRYWLGMCLVFAGVSVLLINYIVPLMGRWFDASGLALWERAMLYALTCFLVPAFFLSTISPQVIRLYLQHLSNAGTLIGKLGAWNALGSILGTGLAGYVLIPLLGTKWILIVLASILLLAGYALAHDRRAWKNLWSVVVALLLIGNIFSPATCQYETNYYCIHVAKERRASRERYLLRLDHLVHSYVDPTRPARVGYGYEQLYRRIIALRETQKSAFFSLFIGGGGYTLPRYLEALYPASTVVVSEIDPGVTEVNYQAMELSRTTSIRTVNQDARMMLRTMATGTQFDFVFGDAFNDFSIPYHLTTVEFHEELKQHMSSRGVYALNVIDDVTYGKFLAAMTRTLQTVWKHVYLAPLTDQIKTGRNTYVLIASDEAIDPAAWMAARVPSRPLGQAAVSEGSDLSEEGVASSTFHFVSDRELEAYLAAHPAPVLRDDYVPLDRYLAPVFHDAY